MQTPRVSVVIPTLRGGPFLREAVESVLGQSLAEWELILVCDGYEGDLSDVVGLDARIKVIRQRNRGASVARNVGIRASRADLIAFIDDDDRMLPGRLAAQVAVMEAELGIGLCHSQFRVIDAWGERIGDGFARDVQYQDLLSGSISLLMPATMMRKSIVEEVGGFDSMLKTGQDLDLIFRVARDSQLAFLPEIYTEYRRHGANASGDALLASMDLELILQKHYGFAVHAGLRSDIVAAGAGLRWTRRYGATGAITLARQTWRARCPIATCKMVLKALRLSPRGTLNDLVWNRAPAIAVVAVCRRFARRKLRKSIS